MPLRLRPIKNWRRPALRVGFPALAVTGVCVYAYVQHGFTIRMLPPVMIFAAAYLYGSFGLKTLGQINYQLLYPTGFSLWISYLLWDPSEHLPFGFDMEYPHMAGLAFGMGVGFIVVMAKAWEDDDGTLVGAIRAMRHYFVVLSIVATAGYAMFLTYAFAMYQVFTEGNHIFALLAFFSMVGFLAFAHNRVKAPTVG